ncbi:LacI family DNA-binding transcriptional regulator [Rhizobacter sp. Root1221]|uniref:LacI family DNA-binding transcriptional regulator n=1 Tax=Rhizobacter sp. Root1221 TaxID=1736433 RepID=UPI0006FFB70A|nr:LacI family DNA-binding transcriptional regulator [Rhizobacter sp. Root1221]KQV85564.1 LacI family transcriptional regulator [Rhizobacter sp. Root1221]
MTSDAPADPPAERRRRSSGRITLADVAKAAGVSPITASRALRRDRGVGEALVAKVQAAADTLGYVPDPAARALASSRSSHVAVLVPLLTNRLFVDLLEAVQSVLLPAGYQSLIGVTHYDTHEEELLLRSYMAHRPAGLIVTGFERSEAGSRLVASSGLPCVHVMETSTAPGVFCVGFSQHDAGYAITEHLVSRGRKRIAFVGAQLDARVLQRAEGYRRCLRDAGLHDPQLEWLDPRRSSIALGGELFAAVLAARPDVDAIFFCNDDIAQGGLLAALRLGVRVPEQVAVAGFNDLEGSDQMLPPLTTVRTPRAQIGAQAAAMLLSLMRGESGVPHNVDVGYELVTRGSS